MGVTLTPRIQTADHLSELIIELREYVGKLHDIAIRGRVANIHDESLPALSPLARQLLEANDVSPVAVPALRQLQTQLEEIRIITPHIRVMLAAWPNASVREQITEQIRISLHPYMVVTFTVRADMGGGCILQAGPRRYDFSFHNQLLVNKHKISELLKAYATA